MKIAVTICEYNPFHNGHAYSLEQIKKTSGADAVVCVMSGNFTERGEIAIMHKYVRAKHAVLAGADLVVELPTVFATAPAEIFASGAVKIAESLSGERTLFFGIENGTKDGLIATASYLLRESSEFKTLLKEELKTGASFARARYNALEKLNPPGIDLGFTTSPNNILALEYAKAVIERGYKTELSPILRMGAGYKAEKPDGKFFSASGIRELLTTGKKRKAAKFMPKFVYNDLPDELVSVDDLVLYALLSTPKKDIAHIIVQDKRVRAKKETLEAISNLAERLM